ncbi:hypothetical protein HS088_TW23G00509 [Tripterygium wilfordii]|uniref:Uncharacterized protein n=1 Tax=Tripterygium wilfordii TaxID=458696 RepID=A0A7J7BV60_TRIWF|nr:hypothetical protein HS088_TW23G00509 [Tripterygium wilfordii]
MVYNTVHISYTNQHSLDLCTRIKHNFSSSPALYKISHQPNKAHPTERQQSNMYKQHFNITMQEDRENKDNPINFFSSPSFSQQPNSEKKESNKSLQSLSPSP